ncbi:type II toxin-antitoxin system RelE/ParE family toxin [Cysteiniphilum sp. JM-1]
MLLGYTYEEEKITLTLLKLGSHENFLQRFETHLRN